MKGLQFYGGFLLLLFSILIGERIIPHQHHQDALGPYADFQQHSSSPDHDEEAEKLHAQWFNGENWRLDIQLPACQKALSIESPKVPIPSGNRLSDYNIQPKILSTLLYIIQLFSAKSPPVI